MLKLAGLSAVFAVSLAVPIFEVSQVTSASLDTLKHYKVILQSVLARPFTMHCELGRVAGLGWHHCSMQESF